MDKNNYKKYKHYKKKYLLLKYGGMQQQEPLLWQWALQMDRLQDDDNDYFKQTRLLPRSGEHMGVWLYMKHTINNLLKNWPSNQKNNFLNQLEVGDGGPKEYWILWAKIKGHPFPKDFWNQYDDIFQEVIQKYLQN